MTTKAQEREALNQIRAIVEGLGADSYIGIALEGCLEIAEQNIDNDWACSMKQRAEEAEKKQQQAEKRAKKAEEDLRIANKELGVTCSRLISNDDAQQIADILVAAGNEHMRTAREAEKEIVENCECPEGGAFKEAVYTRRAQLREAAQISDLMKRNEKVFPYRFSI